MKNISKKIYMLMINWYIIYDIILFLILEEIDLKQQYKCIILKNNNGKCNNIPSISNIKMLAFMSNNISIKTAL